VLFVAGTVTATSAARFAAGCARGIGEVTADLGSTVALDGERILAERTNLTGGRSLGVRAAGKPVRFLRAADGWLAVNLPRTQDVADAYSWADISADPETDVWVALEQALAERTAGEMIERAMWFDLAVARPGEVAASNGSAVMATRLGSATATDSLQGVVVVDFSSLWAGPLCTRILRQAGATVVKVESPSRPDGARFGPPEFFEAVNTGKQSRVVPFDTASVSALIEQADVVVTGSRRAAFERLAVMPPDTVRPRVWLSITAYGWNGLHAHRIGFGDDAAVAGGLLDWENGEPRFVGDAIADPLSGLAGAATVLEHLASGGRWHLDLALARVAAAAAAG
jgi:CoA-transferase family III